VGEELALEGWVSHIPTNPTMSLPSHNPPRQWAAPLHTQMYSSTTAQKRRGSSPSGCAGLHVGRQDDGGGEGFGGQRLGGARVVGPIHDLKGGGGVGVGGAGEGARDGFGCGCGVGWFAGAAAGGGGYVRGRL